MDAILNVSLPVFAIILGGYLAARGGLLGQGSTVALNAFVYYFALPRSEEHTSELQSH